MGKNILNKNRMASLQNSNTLNSKLNRTAEFNSYDAKPDLRGIFCKVMMFLAIIAIVAYACMMVTKNSSSDGTTLVPQKAQQSIGENWLMLAKAPVKHTKAVKAAKAKKLSDVKKKKSGGKKKKSGGKKNKSGGKKKKSGGKKKRSG